jgi:hypothetical protein
MKNLKGLLILLIMGAAIFLVVKLAPPFVSNYNLHEDCDNLVLQFTYAQNATPENMQADVINRAKDHDIILTEENVEAARTQMGVTIDVHYSVPVNLAGRTVNLPFDFHCGNKNITAK